MQSRTDTYPPELPLVGVLHQMKHVYSIGDGVLGTPVSYIDFPCTIGRNVNSSQDILIDNDRFLSKQHARIEARNGSIFVVNLSKKNGTFVNGEKIAERKLAPGDVIRVGGSLFVFCESEHVQRSNLSSEQAQILASIRGSAVSVEALRRSLVAAAGQAETVLLLGESGTGKELAAQALHQMGRRTGKFVAVNCAAISTSTAESLLFGHSRGSFTGAESRHAGFFDEADGGTLFLDEIGDLPLMLQSKLLRVLQDGNIRPLGSNKEHRVDVRVIAATNIDLSTASRNNQFRTDLFQRINAITIKLPPLRERPDDILTLFMSFLGSPRREVSVSLAEALLVHRWPGNVRELQNLARRAITYSDSTHPIHLALMLEQLIANGWPATSVKNPQTGPEAKYTTTSQKRTRVPYSEELLVRLLQENRGVVARLAEYFTVSRREMGRVLSKFRLDPNNFRSRPDRPT